MKLSSVVVACGFSLNLLVAGCLPSVPGFSGSKKHGRSGGGAAADEQTNSGKDGTNTDENADAHAGAKTPAKAKTPATSAQANADKTANQPAGASDCYKADANTCAIELKILALVNAERAKPTQNTGLFGAGGKSPKPALANGKKFGFIAREWSGVQGIRSSIGHDGFPNLRELAFAKEFGASNVEIGGENVAMFGGGGGSAEEVAKQFFDMWYHSPGHYENMMGDYQAVGIGVAQVNGDWYATQIFGAE